MGSQGGRASARLAVHVILTTSSSRIIFTAALLAIQPVHSVAGRAVLWITGQHGENVRRTATFTTPKSSRQINFGSSRDWVNPRIIHHVIFSLGQIGGGISRHWPSTTGQRCFLIMDVAADKYPPAWVKTEDLWNAMIQMIRMRKAKRGVRHNEPDPTVEADKQDNLKIAFLNPDYEVVGDHSICPQTKTQQLSLT